MTHRPFTLEELVIGRRVAALGHMLIVFLNIVLMFGLIAAGLYKFPFWSSVLLGGAAWFAAKVSGRYFYNISTATGSELNDRFGPADDVEAIREGVTQEHSDEPAAAQVARIRGRQWLSASIAMMLVAALWYGVGRAVTVIIQSIGLTL